MATIPDAALANNAKLLGGVGGGVAYTYFAVGSASTAEATTTTTLVSEITDGGFARAAATVTSPSAGLVRWVKEFTASATRTVRAMAIFNAASGGDPGLIHVLASDKVCDSGETFEGTIEITCVRDS